MKKKIVFFTGAGVSKESGINTFRDTDGLWEGHSVMEVATMQGWRTNKQKVLDFYNARKNQLNTVEPNVAHIAIAELEKNPEFEVIVITQNVDNLHERAGSTNVIHLHGELRKMCSSINKTKTVPYVDDIKVGDKHEDGSQLRPFIVWFGEDVPLIRESQKIVETADIFVIVGTSLEVYPAASLIDYADGSCDVFYIDPLPKMSNLYRKANVISKSATEGMQEFIQILNKEQDDK